LSTEFGSENDIINVGKVNELRQCKPNMETYCNENLEKKFHSKNKLDFSAK
jgi:hypothetical protein